MHVEAAPLKRPFRSPTDSLPQPVHVEAAPLKKLFRSLEKIVHGWQDRDHSVTEVDASGLCDIVRGHMVCDSMADLNVVIKSVVESPSIKVVRIKDRFNNPTDGGGNNGESRMRWKNVLSVSYSCKSIMLLLVHIISIGQQK